VALEPRRTKLTDCAAFGHAGARHRVFFAPPVATSFLPDDFEEGLMRALLRHATATRRTAELLLHQDLAWATMLHVLRHRSGSPILPRPADQLSANLLSADLLSA